jgi:uncharacterized protein (DUF486 family)
MNLSKSFTFASMRTIALLIASNVFMTFAWYGHLKFTGLSLWKAILISWGIAFFEYCLMVPANRVGYLAGTFSTVQLKIIQEVITLLVFALFSVFYLKEGMKWNYAVSFFFLLCAVFFAFRKFD